jgi:hypothetical protein
MAVDESRPFRRRAGQAVNPAQRDEPAGGARVPVAVKASLAESRRADQSRHPVTKQFVPRRGGRRGS